jgi:YHS domain-containing protein
MKYATEMTRMALRYRAARLSTLAEGDHSKPSPPLLGWGMLTIQHLVAHHAPEPMEVPDMSKLLDPVCGMTVDDTALRAEGHDDVAFCAPGCRTAFLADPDAFPERLGTAGASSDGGGCGCGCDH